MRVLFSAQVPKDPEYPGEIEDTLRVSEECQRVAVSDGASESFDSKVWASLLVKAYIDHPEFDREWLQFRISDYINRVDEASLSWSKRAAFERGSFATLLGIRDVDETSAIEVLAIGDTLAVFCDGSDFLDSFPYSRSEQFEQHPELLSTRDVLNADFDSPEFILQCKKAWSTVGKRNPTVLIMTDALGQWALRSAEQGFSPWERLGAITETSTLYSLVVEEREAKRMRTDDVTLVRISLTESEHNAVPIP